MEETREELLQQLWTAQDEAYELMSEYDSIPHHYGENILYQAEGHLIYLIANYPGITITDLGVILKKTTSACSQLVRKLKEKGWVEQTRNTKNNRQYNLWLTDSGKKVYEDYREFNRYCQNATFSLLSVFSEEELKHHVMVQRQINKAYQEDVRHSRERFMAAVEENQ